MLGISICQSIITRSTEIGPILERETPNYAHDGRAGGVSQPHDIYVEIPTLAGVSVCKQKRERGLLRLMLSKLHQSATEDVARGQDLGAVIDVLYI